MARYAKSEYTPRHPEKYVGKGRIIARSSWETHFMQFLDSHPSVQAWSSESIRIPYKNPFTGKITHYVPDFMMQYVDSKGKQHVDLIEIKPAGQTHIEMARGDKDKAAIALNYAKWDSARAFAKEAGMNFKILTEMELYHQGTKRR